MGRQTLGRRRSILHGYPRPTISQFAESGLGRITINAGKSRSYGAEAALRASVTKELSLNASYGYTYATFTDYVITEEKKMALP